MVLLLAFVMSLTEFFGFQVLKSLLKKSFNKKRKTSATTVEIPILGKFSRKLSGNPTKIQSFTINKIVNGSRKLVNTTTFEHLVSGAVIHNFTIDGLYDRVMKGKDIVYGIF